MNVRLFRNLGSNCGGEVNASLVEWSGKDDGLVTGRAFVTVDNPGARLGLLLGNASDLSKRA